MRSLTALLQTLASRCSPRSPPPTVPSSLRGHRRTSRPHRSLVSSPLHTDSRFTRLPRLLSPRSHSAMAPQLVPTVPLAVMRSAASSLSSSSSPTPPEPLYTTTVVEIVYASPTAQLSSSSKAGSIASAAAALAQGDIAGGQDVNGYLSFAELGESLLLLSGGGLLMRLLQAQSSPPSSLRLSS